MTRKAVWVTTPKGGFKVGHTIQYRTTITRNKWQEARIRQIGPPPEYMLYLLAPRFTVLDIRTGKDRVYRTEQGAVRFAWRMANLDRTRTSVVMQGGKAWNMIQRPATNDATREASGH